MGVKAVFVNIARLTMPHSLDGLTAIAANSRGLLPPNHSVRRGKDNSVPSSRTSAAFGFLALSHVILAFGKHVSHNGLHAFFGFAEK